MLEDGSVVPIDPGLRQRILKDVDNMAAHALRCLAFAQKVLPPARFLCTCLHMLGALRCGLACA